MRPEEEGSPAPKVVVALALALTAGYVDAFGYLMLGSILVAHMSGNTAGAASELARGATHEALRRFAPIAGFVIGTALGAVLSRAVRRRGVRRRLAIVLGFEAALVVAVVAIDAVAPGLRVLATALLGGAMGVQSAAARHVAGQDVRTTFVTGMMIAAVDDFVLRFLDRADRRRQFAGLHAGIWVAFFLGAAIGGAASLRFGTNALLAAAASLVALAGADVVRPAAPTP